MKITLDLTDSEVCRLRKASFSTALRLKISNAILDVIEPQTTKPANIDLRNCKPGDVLISKHGKKFVYVKYNENDHYPHQITDFERRIENNSRIDDGHVFYRNRQEDDHDIVQIIHNTP